MNGENAAFQANPLNYIGLHPINVVNPVPVNQQGALNAVMNFDLAPKANGTEREVVLNVVPPGAQAQEAPIRTYYVQYTSISLQGNNPRYQDIPRNNPPVPFVFTGQLSGCSLIVTVLDANRYRVFHDARPNSAAAHHQNVVGAFEFNDYKFPNEDTGLGAALMFYLNNHWFLVGQAQQYGPHHQEDPAHGSVAIRTHVFVHQLPQ